LQFSLDLQPPNSQTEKAYFVFMTIGIRLSKSKEKKNFLFIC